MDHVVLGRVGLDHGTSRLTAPSGPPDHLCQQIEGALRRPVVIHIQRRVRAEDAHQRHIFKIQSLGHHLRSQQYRHPLLLKLPQDGLVSHGYGVRVHPQQRRAGEDPMQLLLHPLGANADVLELSAAFGTDLRRFFGIAAVVAHQPSVGTVVGKVHAATRTFGYIGTLGTQQLAAAAPPIEEKNTLLPGCQIFLQFLIERPADDAVPPFPQLLPQIRYDDLRQCLPVVALPQQRLLIVALFRPVRRLHRRGSGTQQQPRALLQTTVFGDVPGVVAG